MKPKIKEIIVVEGKYDKNTLSQVVDATIIETSGFGVFQNDKNLSLIRKLAKERGIIVFTDGDGAGFVIRNYLKSSIPKEYVKHAYIPDIYGKEKRKANRSKEGKLGVEGMTPEIILKALCDAGATINDQVTKEKSEITKADFMDLGLIGDESTRKRKSLIKKLNLPEHISTNALLDVVNVLYSKEEFLSLEF